MFYQYEEMIKERRERLLQEAANERLARLARQSKPNGSLAASTLVWAGTQLTRLGERMQAASRSSAKRQAYARNI